jgi:hypothetical protein
MFVNAAAFASSARPSATASRVSCVQSRLDQQLTDTARPASFVATASSLGTSWLVRGEIGPVGKVLVGVTAARTTATGFIAGTTAEERDRATA